MPKAARGSAPSNPGLKGGHPPLKTPRSIYFSGEGAAKNSGFFQVKLAFALFDLSRALFTLFMTSTVGGVNYDG